MSWKVLVLLFPLVCTYQVPETFSKENLTSFLDYSAGSLKRCKVVYYRDRGLGCQLTENVHIYDTVAVSYPNISISGLSPFYLTPYITNFTHIEKLTSRILYEKYMGIRGEPVTEYVHSLPVRGLSDYNWWTDSEKSLLEEVVYFDHVESLQHMIDYHTSYTKFNSTFYSLEELPRDMLQEDAYKWAWSMVQSRAFSLTHSELVSVFGLKIESVELEDENIPVMIGILDLMNHHPRPINSTFLPHKTFEVQNSTDPVFVLKADREQEYGDEFVFRYGVKNNYSLMMLYGFVVENSSDDYFLYSTDKFPYCYEKRSPEGYCNFLMFPYKLHFIFYRHLREVTSHTRVKPLNSLSELYSFYSSLPETARTHQESRKSLLLAGALYRHLIKPKRPDSLPLRLLRRHKSRFESRIEELIFQYGIQSRLSFWQHMRKVDQLLLNFYKLSLNI